jgi:hypothetical protein
VPATLDDLLWQASALRVDVRSGAEDIVNALGGMKGSGGGGGTKKETPGGMSGTLDKWAASAARASIVMNTFLNVFDKMISALGQGITRFVALANPAAVMRFNMALENAQSALGRVFVPILERFTLVIQQLGNAIESLSPQAKALIAGLTVGGGIAGLFGAIAAAGAVLIKTLGIWPSIIIAAVSALAGVLTTMTEGKQLIGAFQTVLKAVGTVFEALAKAIIPIASSLIVPILQGLGEILKPLGVIIAGLIQVVASLFIPVFQKLGEVIKTVAEFIANIINRLLRLVGMEVEGGFDPNKNRAQAVRQSQITDLRSFANRAYTTAYGGAAENVQGQILGVNQEMDKKLQRIANALEEKNGLLPSPMSGAGGMAERGFSQFGKVGKYGGRALDWAGEPFMMGPRFILDKMGKLFG